MSQAKVDRYKEQKKNRAKIIKKEKREWMLTKAVLGLIAAVMVIFVGGAVYNQVTKAPETTPAVDNTPLETFNLNTSALDDFLNGLTES